MPSARSSSNPSLEMKPQCSESESNSVKPTNNIVLINDEKSYTNESNAVNLNGTKDDELKPSKLLSYNIPDYVTSNNIDTSNATSLVNRLSILKALIIVSSLVVLFFVIALVYFHRKRVRNSNIFHEDDNGVTTMESEESDNVAENKESVNPVALPNEQSRHICENIVIQKDMSLQNSLKQTANLPEMNFTCIEQNAHHMINHNEINNKTNNSMIKNHDDSSPCLLHTIQSNLTLSNNSDDNENNIANDILHHSSHDKKDVCIVTDLNKNDFEEIWNDILNRQ